MNVKDTIETCMRCYPMLFHTRRSVLLHLFCVCGNGYHWEEGELVTHAMPDKVEPIIIDDFTKMMWELMDTKVYPMDDTCPNLFRFPDDIKPDWLEALKETANMVIEMELDKNEREHEQNIHIARMALDKCNKLDTRRHLD